MQSEINFKIVKELYDAFNKKDFSQSQKHIDNNARFKLIPFDMNLFGVEGYLQTVHGWAEAFPDGYCDVQNIYTGEDWAVCEFIGRGTQTGPLISAYGKIMPTGKRVEIAFCDVMKIENGKIVSLNSYFDSTTMMHQLGILHEANH